MADKDIAEKLLEDYNDVFADIINVLVFGGKQIVAPESLQRVNVRSQMKVDGNLHEQERDVAKFWTKHQSDIRIACLGFENQTNMDFRMPLRVISYDGASYRAQLSDKEPCEVITLVLYFGTKRWTAPKRLSDCIKKATVFPDDMHNDYKIKVFEIAYLSQEQINMFKSDFKYIADYIVQMRTNNNYVPSQGTIKHVDAFLKLMAAISNNKLFEEIIPTAIMKGENTMDRFSTMMKDEYEAKGKVAGRTEATNSFATDMIKDGEPANKIMKYTKLSMERLEEIAKSLNTTLVL
ncbi:Rpn family recombination-promoting nuclease/putative transposase [Phascolarctobacterium sp.]|uniref:Rpn family recombination-promoting nuclease/putative transposase n=1 Tax=Phascolarctobacterium sp. TaxID=2049039 RepID=UPI00386D9029